MASSSSSSSFSFFLNHSSGPLPAYRSSISPPIPPTTPTHIHREGSLLDSRPPHRPPSPRHTGTAYSVSSSHPPGAVLIALIALGALIIRIVCLSWDAPANYSLCVLSTSASANVGNRRYSPPHSRIPTCRIPTNASTTCLSPTYIQAHLPGLRLGSIHNSFLVCQPPPDDRSSECLQVLASVRPVIDLSAPQPHHHHHLACRL